MRDFLRQTDTVGGVVRLKLVVSGCYETDYFTLSLSGGVAALRSPMRDRDDRRRIAMRWKAKNEKYLPPEQIICQHL